MQRLWYTNDYSWIIVQSYVKMYKMRAISHERVGGRLGCIRGIMADTAESRTNGGASGDFVTASMTNASNYQENDAREEEKAKPTESSVLQAKQTYFADSRIHIPDDDNVSTNYQRIFFSFFILQLL